jgi:hypothetical protein
MKRRVYSWVLEEKTAYLAQFLEFEYFHNSRRSSHRISASTMMFTSLPTTQSTMMTTAMLALTFTIPMQQASHQTACGPIWSETASPCYQHANAHPNGTMTFFASGQVLLDSEDDEPLSWLMIAEDDNENDPGKWKDDDDPAFRVHAVFSFG